MKTDPNYNICRIDDWINEHKEYKEESYTKSLLTIFYKHIFESIFQQSLFIVKATIQIH